MTYIQAIILGVIQGLTEFLPISSSAHIFLADKVFGFGKIDDIFIVWVHGGTLIALIIYFYKDLIGLFSNKSLLVNIVRSLIFPIIIGAVLALSKYSVYFNPVTTSLALIIIGLGFIMLEKYNKSGNKTVENLTKKEALGIGLFQTLSFISGVSRSGITIIGGYLNKLKFEQAVRMSFISGIPLVGLVFLYGIFKQFGSESVVEDLGVLLTGTITAFIIGYFVIRYMMNTLKLSTLKYYGYYRILIGVLVLLFVK